MSSSELIHQSNRVQQQTRSGLITKRLILITFIVTLLNAVIARQPTVEALWFFQQRPALNQTLVDQLAVSLRQQQQQQQQQLPSEQQIKAAQQQVAKILSQQKEQVSGDQQPQATEPTSQSSPSSAAAEAVAAPPSKSSSYGAYGSSLLSMAGIQPASIATLLNTVGDTGFRYFNIQDQCRNRAACDLGSMLYKKLSFVHNWLIRTSVRTLTDMNNIYTQSWMEGMLGRNCTSVYMSCRQSPLEGLMNLALLQHLAS